MSKTALIIKTTSRIKSWQLQLSLLASSVWPISLELPQVRPGPKCRPCWKPVGLL